MKKLIKMYNEKYGNTLGIIDDDFNKEQMYRIYYFIKNNCDDKEIQDRIKMITLDKPKTLEQQLTKLESENGKVSGGTIDPTIKNDINNIKSEVNELNAQYKDIVKKIESGNLSNNIEPQDNDIPKVFFSGEKPNSKTSVHATMEYKSKTDHFKGYVDIKCQGTSSMAYPKKNYTIKMFTDSTMSKKVKKDFKGWGAQSKFCLKANYIDHSHARNICSAKLWNQIVASRENYALLPELLRTSPCNGAIDGFPIKVYYNNNYEGIYTWNIPKDKWMFNMDDTLDNHCVLCGEEYNSGCFLSANANLWSDEIHDTMPASIVTSFNAFQNFVITSTDEQFKANLENYVYVNSLIDYYIFQYAICGLDAMGKNQLFATYDGTKWIATSYDMDSTFGLYWNGQSFVSATYRMQEDYESGKNGNPNKLYVRLEKLFVNEIKARYKQLRADILSYNNIVNTFEPFMDIIGKDLYAEDLTIYTGIPSGNKNNIQQIRNYYRDRLVYVDAQINALQEATPCTNITLNKTALQLDSSTTSNEPKNYLKDVPSSKQGNDITFDEITIEKGFYKFTNINGGTFRFLNCVLNDAEYIPNGANTSPLYVEALNNTNTLVVHGYPHNDVSNTADKLALYKITYKQVEGTQPITFTKAGNAFLNKNNGTIIQSENDEYCNEVQLDSSKVYMLKFIGEQEKNTTNLSTKVNGNMYPQIKKSVTKGDAVCIFTNITTIQFSTNINTSGNLTDYTLIEITESYEKDTIPTAKLIATVTPTNTTDKVVWTVNPTGICTVENGIVTPIKNGECVITATCGTKSATCNVTVNAIPEQPATLYTLPQETVFNGTSDYVDTGIQLFKTDQDFTITIDVTADTIISAQSCLIHCMKEVSPYPGINVQRSGNDIYYTLSAGNNLSPVRNLIPIGQRTKLVIVKNGTTMKVYNSNNVTGESQYKFTTIDQTLLLGAYQTTDGVKGRFFKGTIHAFSISNTVFTNEQINTYLGVNVATD